METRTIDALLYKKMIVAGAANLKNQAAQITNPAKLEPAMYFYAK